MPAISIILSPFRVSSTTPLLTEINRQEISSFPVNTSGQVPEFLVLHPFVQFIESIEIDRIVASHLQEQWIDLCYVEISQVHVDVEGSSRVVSFGDFEIKDILMGNLLRGKV